MRWKSTVFKVKETWMRWVRRYYWKVCVALSEKPEAVHTCEAPTQRHNLSRLRLIDAWKLRVSGFSDEAKSDVDDKKFAGRNVLSTASGGRIRCKSQYRRSLVVTVKRFTPSKFERVKRYVAVSHHRHFGERQSYYRPILIAKSVCKKPLL